MKPLILLLPLAFFGGWMRDKTFNGVWSNHKFANGGGASIIRKYDSFTEKGECFWSGSFSDFIAGISVLNERPYLQDNKSIILPHWPPKPTTYKVRFDENPPIDIKQDTRHPWSDIKFSKWSKYKRIRIRSEIRHGISRPTFEDLDIDTKKLIDALRSYEDCNSLN